MTQPTAFKSPEGEAEYLAAYDAAMKAFWTVPFEEMEVPSRFGMTHVVASGPEDAPPLVLLHGFMGNLTMWSPYAADLSKTHRIYAMDTMGHPNMSVPNEPIRDEGDFAAWLVATLDGLNLDRPSMAGISFGGWLALNLATAAPERVHKLVLLSPAASFQPLSKQIGLRAILSRVIPTRGMMDSFMGWFGLEAEPDDRVMQGVLDLVWLGGTNYRMSPETMRVMPTLFPDEKLRALEVPVLLLIGENEVMYDPLEAVDRARRLIPNLDAELVPDCKHEMWLSQQQIVEPRVLDFLNED